VFGIVATNYASPIKLNYYVNESGDQLQSDNEFRIYLITSGIKVHCELDLTASEDFILPFFVKLTFTSAV